jgi:hypothetical protein
MIITRKIEIFVCESDKDLKKLYLKKLYDNRNIAVKVANMCASHLFALDNTMPYLSDTDKEIITFLGVKGDKSSRNNAPYVVASQTFKGSADMGMVSCVIQNVRKMYQDDKKMEEHGISHYVAIKATCLSLSKPTDLPICVLKNTSQEMESRETGVSLHSLEYRFKCDSVGIEATTV